MFVLTALLFGLVVEAPIIWFCPTRGGRLDTPPDFSPARKGGQSGVKLNFDTIARVRPYTATPTPLV